MPFPATSARVDADAIRAVDDALTSRRSIRAFLPTRAEVAGKGIGAPAWREGARVWHGIRAGETAWA